MNMLNYSLIEIQQTETTGCMIQHEILSILRGELFCFSTNFCIEICDEIRAMKQMIKTDTNFESTSAQNFSLILEQLTNTSIHNVNYLETSIH